MRGSMHSGPRGLHARRARALDRIAGLTDRRGHRHYRSVADSWDEEPTAHGIGEPASTSSERQATLTVLTGSATGQMFKVVRDLSIGRAPTSDIRLDDDGVSRNHARVGYLNDAA